MARPKRTWHPRGHYHIVTRGNNRQNIFQGKADVNEYFRVLQYVYEKYKFFIYAFCIMNNHYHLLLQSPEVHLSKLMALLNKRYSDYFRKKHQYTGQIYESRYFSKEVMDPISLLNTGAYIHRNPIETKLPMVRHMQDYPFSSYKYYYYNTAAPYPFLDVQLLPSLLPVGREKSKKEYAKYCVEYEKKKKSHHPLS